MSFELASQNRDLVVVIPGIGGSTLGLSRDGETAAENMVWAPSAGVIWRGLLGTGLRIQNFPCSLGIGDGPAEDGIEPVALMPDLRVIPGLWTPIRGYSRLISFLGGLGYRQSGPLDPRPGNLLPFPYDWRLSNRYNATRLAAAVEPALDRWRARGAQYADAQVVLIGHSMGGLIARWYLEKCGGAEITRKLITLGTPWRGATKTIDHLVNGTTKRLGPLALDLSAFTRSLPSAYQLLPEFACIGTGDTWSRTTEVTLPNLDGGRVKDAMRFHTDLQVAERHRPGSLPMTHMITGVAQPTITTVTITDTAAVTSESFGVSQECGDGTVPLAGAIGHDQTQSTNVITRVADLHGNLQSNQAVLDQIQSILTSSDVRRKTDDAATAISARVPELLCAGDALTISVRADLTGAAAPTALLVQVQDDPSRHRHYSRQVRLGDGSSEVTIPNLPPGAHTVTISGTRHSSPVGTVTATTIVWPKTA